ncbi:hypothetical protein ABW20_dc0102168 [Dactylellina cionopaga]|nr:hypothetical protein ABW20_dc0102168 [Dactylellina cionopaga]
MDSLNSFRRCKWDSRLSPNELYNEGGDVSFEAADRQLELFGDDPAIMFEEGSDSKIHIGTRQAESWFRRTLGRSYFVPCDSILIPTVSQVLGLAERVPNMGDPFYASFLLRCSNEPWETPTVITMTALVQYDEAEEYFDLSFEFREAGKAARALRRL